MFVTNLGLYVLNSKTTISKVTIGHLLRGDYINRQYGFVSKQIMYNMEFQQITNIRIPARVKEATFKNDDQYYRLSRMDKQQYEYV